MLKYYPLDNSAEERNMLKLLLPILTPYRRLCFKAQVHFGSKKGVPKMAQKVGFIGLGDM